MVYEFKASSRISADVNKIVAEIESIGDMVTPTQYVKFAENPESESHKTLTWDDTTAADLYRVEEARKVIRAIVIVPDEADEDKKRVSVRAYENVTDSEGNRGYVTTRIIMADEHMSSELFATIYASIDKLVDKLEAYEDMYEDISHKRIARKVRKKLNSAKELLPV